VTVCHIELIEGGYVSGGSEEQVVEHWTCWRHLISPRRHDPYMHVSCNRSRVTVTADLYS
jgi:hypothetical protein